MLTFTAADISGGRLILPAPAAFNIRMEEDVPADDLYAVFPYIDHSELTDIAVYDGSKLVFTGVIDEEEHILNGSSDHLRISARSLAALLLDNEAEPCCYDHPGARQIYERYAADLGIAAGDVDDATCFGELNVTKGTSRWSVIRSFCAACYSTVPRVSADGVLYMRGLTAGDTTVFGGDGVRYTELSERILRCEEISRVNVKVNADGGYGYPVENTDAERRGIKRERYMNALLTGTPIKRADAILQRSKEKAYMLTLRCPGLYMDIQGNNAVLDIGGKQVRDDLYVSSVICRMDSSGESTAVTLKRRNI